MAGNMRGNKSHKDKRMTTKPSLSTLLEFAIDAAYQAGKITLSYFQNGVSADRKSDDSPVTIADKLAEEKLRELIQRYWPDHGIIGEEYGEQAGTSEYTWTVDPIDGTKSFVQGVPIYSNLISVVDASRRPLVGVANYPALNEMIYASQGMGTYWNGRRTHASNVSDLKDAVLLGSEIDFSAYGDKERIWKQLQKTTYFHRTWGDSYGYALLATGRAEIMVDAWMKTWDCGPLLVIVEEAGGTFTDFKGNATIWGGEAIGTNGKLYDAVMAIVNGS